MFFVLFVGSFLVVWVLQKAAIPSVVKNGSLTTFGVQTLVSHVTPYKKWVYRQPVGLSPCFFLGGCPLRFPFEKHTRNGYTPKNESTLNHEDKGRRLNCYLHLPGQAAFFGTPSFCVQDTRVGGVPSKSHPSLRSAKLVLVFSGRSESLLFFLPQMRAKRWNRKGRSAKQVKGGG